MFLIMNYLIIKFSMEMSQNDISIENFVGYVSLFFSVLVIFQKFYRIVAITLSMAALSPRE